MPPIPRPPAVYEFAAIERTAKKTECFRFACAGPIAGFDLDEHDIGRSDADNIPRPAAGCRPGTGVPGGFQQRHAAVFVPRAFGAPVHAEVSVSSAVEKLIFVVVGGRYWIWVAPSCMQKIAPPGQKKRWVTP